MDLKIDLLLVEKIEEATRKAIISLYNNHKEKYYYISLITDGEGHCPLISAWSQEALERSIINEKDPNEAKMYIKWSYADSPYYAYGEEYFSEVDKIFQERMKVLYTEDEIQSEIEVRINSMERVMANLDKEGLFGRGKERMQVVINAEVMPPDYGNTERAIRLNPREAIEEWLIEIAEEE